MMRLELGGFLALALLGCAPTDSEPTTETRQAAAVSKPTYRYVSLDEAGLPEAMFSDWFGLGADGRVFGNAWTCGEISCDPTVIVHHHGTTRARGAGYGVTVNRSGVVGGSVTLDAELYTSQAALFTDAGVQLIPLGSDEMTSSVLRVSDSGTALVEAYTLDYESRRLSLVDGEGSTPLSFGDQYVTMLDLNAAGLISGTAFGRDSRAFRHDPRTGAMETFEPEPGDTDTWAQGIDSAGNVLGYSFIPGGRERIGFWDRRGVFHEWFVEGTEQFPTVSNRLGWNQRGLITITDSREDLNSYIVPHPGARFALADITTGDPLPAWTSIVAVNDGGDILGYGGPEMWWASQAFVLQKQ